MKYKIYSKNPLEAKITNKFSKYELSEEADFIFSFGGDGTLLKSVRLNTDKPDTIYIPFNLGHVGYYTEFEIEDLDTILNDIDRNLSYEIKEYSKLDIEVKCKDNIHKTEVLNEIAITNPIRTAVIDIYIDGKMFETYRGTGLLISTPSGSTAYNKSVGGSVIDLDLEVMQLTEIAPINNYIYKSLNTSLVLSKTKTLDLIIHNEEKTFICTDGKSFCEDLVDRVTIKFSNDKVKVLKNSRQNTNQYDKIKNTFLK